MRRDVSFVVSLEVRRLDEGRGRFRICDCALKGKLGSSGGTVGLVDAAMERKGGPLEIDWLGVL